MKRFKQEHYEKVFAKPKQSDIDTVEEFLKSKGIPFHNFSANGITPSIAIHFGDAGEREDVEAHKKSKNRRAD